MFDQYRNRMKSLGAYSGAKRRSDAEKIMKATWKNDAATKPVYVKFIDGGLPEIDEDDIPVYAKYNVKSYHNITGDAISYLLQFLVEDVSSNENIRVGAYVNMENEFGEKEWLLIVHLDDRTQFRQFSILKCTWIYKWVANVNGVKKIFECLGAPRKQNSYNSGVWLDYCIVHYTRNCIVNLF